MGNKLFVTQFQYQQNMLMFHKLPGLDSDRRRIFQILIQIPHSCLYKKYDGKFLNNRKRTNHKRKYSNYQEKEPKTKIKFINKIIDCISIIVYTFNITKNFNLRQGLWRCDAAGFFVLSNGLPAFAVADI